MRRKAVTIFAHTLRAIFINGKTGEVKMKNIRVNTEPSYMVEIGAGTFDLVGEFVRTLRPNAEKVAVVSDDNVAQLWAGQLEQRLRETGLEVVHFVIRSSENEKTFLNYYALIDFLAAQEMSRNDILIALGGGTVGDLAGFAAATYFRGIPLVMLPTSLLAMVDAAVGGKMGIDLPSGKGLVGTFYEPLAVFCDTNTIDTLPRQRLMEGCAEVLKYGIIGDSRLFYQIVSQGLDFDREQIIAKCVSLKAKYVVADEHDYGARRVLNLGHTVGHAIERCSGYTVTHGFAVAMGMGVIARAGAAHGVCSTDCAAEIEAGLAALGLPNRSTYSLSELMPFVLRDKKRSGCNIDLIVPERIGRCRTVTIPVEALGEYLYPGF